MNLPPLFQQQLSVEEWASFRPARVAEVHRSQVVAWAGEDTVRLDLQPGWPALAVGDWILLDAKGGFERLLNRQSVFQRKAAGSDEAVQLIAANIDTLLIVSGMNDDFNLNRFERYLALANEAGAHPVLVLTRADECPDVEDYLQSAAALGSSLDVVAVNALDPQSCSQLEPWLGAGQTLAMLGSSGAGKSTLLNTLLGEALQPTGGIREKDSKGRHTTTARSLHRLPGGALVIDTPGMRELQLAFVADGIRQTFSDIDELAQACRFADCRHGSEPGCAVQRAIGAGELDERRLVSYLKLQREDARNSATLAERRASDRKLGRFYKSVLAGKKRDKDR